MDFILSWHCSPVSLVFTSKKRFSHQKSTGVFPVCATQSTWNCSFLGTELLQDIIMLFIISPCVFIRLPCLVVCLAIHNGFRYILCEHAPSGTPHLSLHIYSICLNPPLSLAALIPTISPNILPHAEKSIFSNAPRLASGNIDGKHTNQNGSVDSCMESTRRICFCAFKINEG